MKSYTEDIYICIDLETTGLRPTQDEIIEVGAVKFRNSEILDTFQALVNPHRQIGQFITDLTGITQAELDKELGFSQIAQQLTDFIGIHPIVGQNVQFDINFLTNKGFRINNDIYDTREIASIVLPTLKDYSLYNLARSLSITHDKPHRALEDAIVTAKVFDGLTKLVEKLDPLTLSQISLVYSRAGISLSNYFMKSNITVDSQITDQTTLNKQPMPGIDPKEHQPQLAAGTVELPDTSDFFGQDGLLSKVIKNYRYRKLQVQMAESVGQAMAENRTLLVEGGTGVGKSMAYLIPSILHAMENKERVVISTNTINLQEQLVRQDLPALFNALNEWSSGFVDSQFSLLKGRDNYLCHERLQHIVAADSISHEEARMASKILVWLKNTSSGDRSEMNIPPREMHVWSRMSSLGCVTCQTRTSQQCFLKAAKEKAKQADMVIVNHSLLVRDFLEKRNELIPNYDYLVIDEAHHLEDEASNQMSSNLSQESTDRYIERLNNLLEVYIRYIHNEQQSSAMQDRLDSFRQSISTLNNSLNAFWKTMDSFLGMHQQETDARHTIMRLNHNTRSQPNWHRVEIGSDAVDQCMINLNRHLELLQASPGDDLSDSITSDLDGCLELTKIVRTTIKDFVYTNQNTHNTIYWISQDKLDGNITLNTAPMNVGNILQSELFSKKNSVILTSATLTTHGHFNYIRERLGIGEADEIKVDSPFDYPRAALIYIPQDMPNPNSRNYQKAVQQAIIDVCVGADGHTLGLFTSHAAIQATRNGIKNQLEGLGYRVFSQGIDGTPGNLLNLFMDNPKSVLLGTASFWDGVDIPGDALKALVLPRLPFNVPTDPIFAARSELFEDPFNDYAIPKSVIRFRQGFGRLIRSESEKGAVVILDERIISRPYGKVFLNSLPHCAVLRGNLSGISSEIKQWIAKPL